MWATSEGLPQRGPRRCRVSEAADRFQVPEAVWTVTQEGRQALFLFRSSSRGGDRARGLLFSEPPPHCSAIACLSWARSRLAGGKLERQVKEGAW